MSKSISKKNEVNSAVKEPAGKFDFITKLKNLSQEDKIGMALLLLLVFITVTIRSKFSGIPFERDEGTYAYYGKLLLEGGIPYKDFYEQKFPGIFYFFAMIVSLFGDTVQGMHKGFMYVNILTLIFIYFTSRNLFSAFAGVVSAATFVFVSMTPNLSGYTVQGEHGVIFFSSLGFLFYSIARFNSDWKYYLLMGLSLGAAFMVKTSGVFFVAAGGIIILTDFFFTKGKKDYKQLFKIAFIYGGGAAAVVIFMFLLIYLKGSFNEMLFWTFEIPKKYVGKMPFSEGKKYLDYTYQAITNDYNLFWRHSFFALIVCLFAKAVEIKTKVFAFILIAFSCATIVPGFYFYGHYWIQILPGLSVLAGLTYFSLINILKDRMNVKSPNLKYVYLALFGIVIFFHTDKLKNYYFHPNYEQIVRAVYGNNPFPEAMEIGNYINRVAKPEDQIIVMGSEPEIYFYTKKNCPSRHAYFAAIVDNIPEHKIWQREFVADVEKAKPKYFIFFKHQISLFVQPNTDQYVFQWANKYIQDHYKLAGLVDMIDGQRSTYIFDESAQRYQPKSQSYIMIFERIN
jgi:hypothetical protein